MFISKLNQIIAALIVLLLISAGVILVLLRGDEDTWLCTAEGWVKHGHPSAAMPQTTCPAGNLKVQPPANGSVEVKIANPASANCLDKGNKLEGKTDESGQYNICIFPDDTRCEEWAYFRNECQPGKNIIAFSPQAGADVTLPFKISGQARVFENTFNYRLKDSGGIIIASGIGQANSPDMGKFGDFEININSLLKKPAGKDVILEIFDSSAKDGSEIDLLSIPLKLSKPETSVIKVYFSNDKLDPEITCIKVFPVERIIPKTQSVGHAALEQLLAGLSNEEYQKGYRSNINTGVKLNSLTITDGVARADFDETLQAGVGGSCRVGAISAQIRETLKQFPTVKEVIISINGRTEDILQP